MKSKILLRQGKKQSIILIEIANQLLEEVKEFSYLDCKIRKGGTCAKKKKIQHLLSKLTILVGTRRYYFYNK